MALTLAFTSFTFFLTLPNAFYGDGGNDPSWQIAMHLAHRAGLVVGRQFVFTYGPLGVLSTRLPFADVRWPLVASDLLLWSAILYCLFDLFRRAPTLSGCLAIGLSVFTVTRAFYFHDLVIVEFCLVLFFLFKYRENPRLAYLLVAALFSGVIFLVKVNIAMVSSTCLLSFVLLRAAATRRYRRYLAFAGLYALALPASAALANAAPLEYVRASTHFIAGYNEAMFHAPEGAWYLLYLALAVMGGLAGATLSCCRQVLEEASWALLALFVCGFEFLLFKQSFVRADGAHMPIFFNFAALPIGLLCLFSNGRYRRALNVVVVLSLVVCFRNAEENFTPSYLGAKLDGFHRYLAEAALSGEAIAGLRAGRGTALAPEVLRYVRSGSVDVIPRDASIVLRSSLEYDPRPVPQSYSAYDAYLDRMNYDKYVSQTAPDWLLFASYCTDHRYCFADEAQTKIGMLENYAPVLSRGGQLLLRRREEPRRWTRRQVAAGQLRLGERFPVPSSFPVEYIRLGPTYSLAGRLRDVFFQPPELRLELGLESGKVLDYRAVKPIVEGGFLINRLVRNQTQARRFFAAEFEKLPRVEWLRLYSPQPWGFEPNVTYRLESIEPADRS